MLILQRRTEEEVVIGRNGEIRLRVLGVKPCGAVALGITADPSVPVHRLEVFESIRAEQSRGGDAAKGG